MSIQSFITIVKLTKQCWIRPDTPDVLMGAQNTLNKGIKVEKIFKKNVSGDKDGIVPKRLANSLTKK